MRLVTAKQMQDMDRFTIQKFGIPGLVLMENAGKGAADMFMRLFSPGQATRVAVMAGRGNNGGDGVVTARYLANAKIPVTVFLLAPSDKVSGDAKINLDLYQNLLPHCPHARFVEIPDEASLVSQKNTLMHQDIFIDALLGTGLNAPVTGRFHTAIQWMNQSGKPVFAMDIASGLHADTGKPQGIAVRASTTATFAHAKAGHVLYPGNEYTNQLEVIDIGIPEFVSEQHPVFLSLMNQETICNYFSPRRFDSHKGSFGHVLVVAGSSGKTGAAALCANAAARSGAGLVTLGYAESLHQTIEPQITEPMSVSLPEVAPGILSGKALEPILALAENRQVLAMGPGIGTHEQTKNLVMDLVQQLDIPMILDADALNCLAGNTGIFVQAKAPVILTPHPGEMARLCKKNTADIQNNRLEIAREFARKFQVTLVLKGAQTLVALADGQVFCCPAGNPGMASGGMGDVLTGMIAGFATQGMSPEKAAIAGVYIHGLAGDILAQRLGNIGFLASDMVKTIPAAIQTLMQKKFHA